MFLLAIVLYLLFPAGSILPKRDKLVKPDASGKYPILMRMAVEVCTDELTMEWHDKGVSPVNIEQARAFVRLNVPKHTASRIVVNSKQILEVNYADPSYLG